MFVFFKKQKYISKLLIVSLIISIFLPVPIGLAQTPSTPANTAVPTGMPTSPGYPQMDYAVQTNTYLLVHNTWTIAGILSGQQPGAQQDNLKAGIFMRAVKIILRQVTNSIVAWIDSGFKGNPAFITNTKQFLQNTADITVGDFLMNDPALNFLCDPFKIQLKLAIGLQYRPFKEQIACTFTGALGNVTDAMNKFTNGDFIGGGGWNSWLTMTTQPQNNQWGAMILAQNELDVRISGNKEVQLAEANWGGGFMSWKDCPEPVPLVLADAPEQIDAQNTRLDKYAAVTGQERGDSGCVTKTPGGVIANKINWADTSTIRELELANDFNAIINALLNQVILMGMGSLSDAGLLGGKKPSQDNTFNEYMAYLGTLDTQLAANEAQLAANQGSSNGTGSYKPDGSINFSQNFANRAVALETINNQLAIENQYLGTQNTIFNLIDATQNAFASSTCSDTIKTEVTNQITGDYTGVKDLTWNKTDIARVSPITVNNITSLTSVLTAVQNNTNDAAVPGLVAPLTTMNTLHSAAIVSSYASGGTLYNQIRNWLVGKVTSNTCVGITPASLGL